MSTSCSGRGDQSAGGPWFARDPFIAHGEMINERRRNSCGLLQVVFEDVVVGVHVRVRSPRIVALHIVSYPLECGQAHFIKRHMICGRDVCDGQCRSAEVFVWLEQVAENWLGGFVTLQVESTNAAGTVVEIEIGVEFLMFRLELVVSTAGLVLRSAHFPSEVGGYVGVRTERPLLLRAPQADADGSPGLQLQGLQDTDYLQRSGCPGGIVGGAGA